MLYPDSSSSVSPEFQEIATEYYSQISIEYRDLQSKSTHKRTASYEPYEVIFSQVKDAVKLGLQIPQKNTSKTNNTLKTRSIKESDSEERFSDDLDWESESDSDCDCESLIEFRTDGEFASLQKVVETMTEKLDEVVKVHNQVELDQRFQSELLKSSMLADFHERYILKALERRRLENDTIENIKKDVNLAQSVWNETLQANPMQVLENIGRNLPPKEDDIGLTATIHEMEELVEISDSSKEYSKYIPSFATRLNVDDKLFDQN
ncbi:hypothetical protein HDV04_003198 [Boothiomyces sp. JEL0838]|nr:hypothetical protein HDV04_003198 [Boothiomyces sp. JEL0838]